MARIIIAIVMSEYFIKGITIASTSGHIVLKDTGSICLHPFFYLGQSNFRGRPSI